MMHALFRLAAPAALAATLVLPAAAQEQPNLMIVFDGSGSMWGQVGGRTKIELARQALSSVLSEASPDLQIGMMAYGHRVRGQCSDIELMVPMGPAVQTVPRILDGAARMNPRGMTPLTDAVLMAARRMGHTEQAATVVLLTDGIETCGGDPCALGRQLAAEGIDFRAHVVGFDLSDAEQRQVSCLAQETGGMFIAASNATELRDALAQTLALAPQATPQPAPEPEPDPAMLPRPVELILRDVAGGPVLSGRPFRSVELLPLDDQAEVEGRLDLALNAGPLTGRAMLRPGRYQLLAVRQTDGRTPIRIALPVEIPPGTGAHTVDLVIAARLRIEALLHAGEPMPEGNGRVPSFTGQGWALFQIHPVIDGAIDPSVDYGGINSRDVALPPGDYFVRGILSETFTRERLVSVQPGETTVVPFDFAAASLRVDLRDAAGFPIDRVRLEVHDLDSEEPFASGRGRNRTELMPILLPEGTWRITAREDRGGAPRGEVFVTVAAGQPATLSLTPGTVSDPANLPEAVQPLCLDTHSSHGCVVEAVTPRHMVQHLGLNGSAADQQLAPRYTGTWQTHGGMMALVQDGRRVWGEVHVNGGIGLVWGHVAPDGLTLRGAMDRSSNPRGVTELRIDPLAESLRGFWDHNIGRMGSTVSARRVSGGLPPLTRATGTGTEDDLRLDMQGRPWAPADSRAFGDFMAPARAAASPDTGEDIDAMQATADPESFAGVWNTNQQQLTLAQEGRSVWGRRDRGALWGEVSADGLLLRGLWVNAREWGFLEFRLNPDRMGFVGAWGRPRDGGVRERWDGARVGWLAPPVEPVDLPTEATGPVLDAFMEPVRDADLIAPGQVAPANPDPDDHTLLLPGDLPNLIRRGFAGFEPAFRWEFLQPGATRWRG